MPLIGQQFLAGLGRRRANSASVSLLRMKYRGTPASSAISSRQRFRAFRISGSGGLEGRQGDKETGRQGDGGRFSISLSPCLLVSLSRCFFSLQLPQQSRGQRQLARQRRLTAHHLAAEFRQFDHRPVAIHVGLLQAAQRNQGVDHQEHLFLLEMLQQPEGAQLVQPQLGHLGAARAAEHLGDEIPAAGNRGLGAGDAAEDHADGLQKIVGRRSGGLGIGDQNPTIGNSHCSESPAAGVRQSLPLPFPLSSLPVSSLPSLLPPAAGSCRSGRTRSAFSSPK